MNQLVRGYFTVIKICIKKWLRTGILTLVITFFVTSFLLFPIFPISEENMLQNWVIPLAHANVFTDILERFGLYTPPRKGVAATGNRSGGAGRGPICALPDNVQSNNSLQALMPVDNQENQEQGKQKPETDTDTEFVGGLTISEQPTFWFYLPYVADPETPETQRRIAQFVLLDEADHPVWNELISAELHDTPSLVEYLLPYRLETDKLYQWYFTVICDVEKLSRNPVVRGWVQRIEPTPELQTALENASGFDRHVVYARNQIAFEAMNSLVNIQRQFPNIKIDDWNSLLEYFDISDANQFDFLKPVELIEREVIKGIQFPARM